MLTSATTRILTRPLRSLFSSYNCWKCKKDNQAEQLQCNTCGYLQDPDFSIKKQNFFTVLRIPPNFMVDKKLIDLHCRESQKRYHPDKFSSKESKLHAYANEFSSYLNEAREVLLNDVKRMAYMLEIKGFKLNGDENDHQMGIDPSFISNIFELQEQMQESSSAESLEQTRHTILKEQQKLQRQFHTQYSAGKFEQARTTALKYKYFETTLQTLLRKKTALLMLDNELLKNPEHKHAA